MSLRHHPRAKRSRGQSLVETALLIPLLLILILNAVNFGYFLLVTLNLTSATRNGIEYAIEGSSTPRNQLLPGSGALSASNAQTVKALIAQELGAFNKNNKLDVNICSVGGGVTDSEHIACGPSQTGDPEATNGFALVHIDISYTFNTLIPTTAFNLVVGALPPCDTNGSCTFTRHAEMRAMGS